MALRLTYLIVAAALGLALILHPEEAPTIHGLLLMEIVVVLIYQRQL